MYDKAKSKPFSSAVKIDAVLGKFILEYQNSAEPNQLGNHLTNRLSDVYNNFENNFLYNVWKNGMIN